MAVPSSSSSSCGGPQWSILSPQGPALAHHVGCIISDVLYLHGGIDKKGSTSPLNTLHCMDLECGIWNRIEDPAAPALSHHACLVLQNRYILLNGGWNGKIRCTDVFVFDTVEKKWFSPQTSGFPVGGGLSSHSITLMRDGNILVVGREGSVRIQRRTGNAYILSGNFTKGYTYTEHPTLVPESRSGHSALTVGNKFCLLYGRNDKHLEVHSNLRTVSRPCAAVTNMSGLTKTLAPMAKPPCGRRNHVAIAGGHTIFVHGGETFDGRSREPVGEMFLIMVETQPVWYKLGACAVCRAGHVCCTDGERVILHGGEGARGVIYPDSYILHV